MSKRALRKLQAAGIVPAPAAPPPRPPTEYLAHLPPEALQAALVLCRLADFFCLTHEVLTDANLTSFKARVGMLKACLDRAQAEGLQAG